MKKTDRILAAILSTTLVSSVAPALADEGGVSFWLPGLQGSFAATPQQPGWSLATVYYHATVHGGGDVAAAREATIGRIPANINIDINANLKARADLIVVNPTYVFSTPILGGQLALGVAGIYGRSTAAIAGTITTNINNVIFVNSGRLDDSLTGFGDLYPTATLRWNDGVNNYMTYVSGDIPVGNYNSARLANVGIGHGAVDWGVGYTYFNPAKGQEFSVVSGLTYNLKNPDTDYRNGTDLHIDWGAAQFLSKQFFVGAVGYLYNQLGADSGAPAFLGGNKSRTIGVGPQAGYLFPIGNMQGTLSLKAYWDVDTAHRAEGWNVWLAFVIGPQALAEKK